MKQQYQKTIPELQEEFALLLNGLEFGIYASQEQAGKTLMGRHLSIYVPAHQSISHERRERLKAHVERYYGKVKKVTVRKGNSRGIFYGGNTLYRTITFEFFKEA